MRFANWRTAARFVLLLVLAGSSWWLLQMAAGPVPEFVSIAPRQVDTYLRNFKVTVMDEQGKPRQHISGEYLAHFPESRSSEVQRPVMVLFGQAPTPWELHAEQGMLYDDKENVDLMGRVDARNVDSQGREVTITTSDVTVNNQQQTARTAAAVSIKSWAGTTLGQGLDADFRVGHFTLLSQVKGEYEVKQP